LRESLELPVVDTEFIEENKKINSKTHRNGGPYSRSDRDKRRQEVYKLHFEYGYSARKISELMKMNRNTINGDIDYWYSKTSKNSNIFNPEGAIILNIQRLEIQRTRLREQLDKAKSFQERLALERLIYEIDCKILYTVNKLAESSKRIFDISTERLNQWMKKNKKDNRYLTLFDEISVSEKAHKRIEKIIKEDRMRSRF
jgi:predicted phosphohydrolase